MTDMPGGVCVAAFHATYAVLKAEKTLKGLGISVKLIPVPRQISSNCGIAVRFSCADAEPVLQAIQPLRADLEGVYRQAPDGAYRRLEEDPAGPV